MKQNIHPDDVVYIYHGAISGYRFYKRTYPLVAREIILGDKLNTDLENYARDMRIREQKGRYWILMSHVGVNNSINEAKLMEQIASERGEKLKDFRAYKAGALLFDFS